MLEDIYIKILEYLKTHAPTNTFHLARALGVDRYKLLNSIEKLEKLGAVEVRHGIVKFLKFVAKEKKIIPKQAPKKIKRKAKSKSKKISAEKEKVEPYILTELKTENLKLKERLLELESKVKELEQKQAQAPKIIKKTIIKNIIKKIPVPIPIQLSSPERASKKKKRTKAVKKFKLPKLTFMKYVKQLKKPLFIRKGD